jgi:hypothetical protein
MNTEKSYVDTRKPELRVLPVVGTGRKSWQIVNEHGALVRYFDGSVADARREAKLIDAVVVLK